MAQLLPRKQLMAGGMIDYALGAEPFTGAFTIVHEDRSAKCKELAYFKMGDGPFYVFYTPYHLPQLQIASTIARAVLFNDATVAPAGPPICEVVAIAKRDLPAGAVVDGVGGFDCYGVIENRRAARAETLLPIGLSEGCRLKRAVAKDSAISSSDVEFPANRLCDKLWAEQEKVFSGS
jgi:predicted homoserine dehydrogenase-like protein